MNFGRQAIPFLKASACGNDFLLIDGALAPPDAAAFTRLICDRHDGVGADGVEWLYPHSTADVEIRLINADGSAAEISGNGTRCVAASLCAEQGKERISLLTGAGLKTCSLISRRDSEYEFEIDMGEGVVEPEFAVRLSDGEIQGIPVSLGNPHFVVLVAAFPSDWQSRSTEIQRSSQFAHGVNVEWVAVVSEHEIQARFFERGAGETRSSGTGSCASALAAIAAGKVRSPVKVHAPGGTQTVRTDGSKIFLRGMARVVARGEFFFD